MCYRVLYVIVLTAVALALLLYPRAGRRYEVAWGFSPDSQQWAACLVSVKVDDAGNQEWETIEDGCGDSRVTSTGHLLAQLEILFGKQCASLSVGPVLLDTASSGAVE